MRRVLARALALSIAALALVFAATGGDGRLLAFAVGLGLFHLDVLLISWGAAAFLSPRAENLAEENQKPSPWLVGALFLKVMLLGAGCYVALSIVKVDALFFVSGLGSSLVIFAVSAVSLKRHFSLSTDAEVR